MADIAGFVHIVESPSPADLLDSRTEGKVLSEALDLAGIKRFYNLATNEEMFKKAIWDRLIECWQKVPDKNLGQTARSPEAANRGDEGQVAHLHVFLLWSFGLPHGDA
jgi:hypothetical protein